jgi:hypothetical protein
MTKKAMYDELMGAMSDIMKVLKARAEGKDPFPESKKDAVGKGEKKEKVKRAPRAPSAYNNYMKGVQDMVKAKVRDPVRPPRASRLSSCHGATRDHPLSCWLCRTVCGDATWRVGLSGASRGLWLAVSRPQADRAHEAHRRHGALSRHMLSRVSSSRAV